MSFTFDSASQRVLPHVIEALQRLQRDPDQLARERDQRYDEPPPPYAESGETTQPPSPGIPVVVGDVVQEQSRLGKIRDKSLPLDQFKAQAKREEERLHDQLFEERWGRRRTLPFDEATDYGANAENNVRARWVEQGIWGEEWGPAWPQGIRPQGFGGMPAPSYDGPFYGSYSLAASDLLPGCQWGHEQGNTPSPSPSPPPSRPRTPDALLFVPRSRPRSPPPPPRQPRPRFQIAFVLPDDNVVVRVAKPTVRDPEASRPLPQFLYQVTKEREWIKDETAHKTPGRAVDLDSFAYQSVKQNWIKDGIWSPKWNGELPGSSWYHEEPESWGPIDRQRPPPTMWTETFQRPADLTAEESRRQARRRGDASSSPALDQNHRPVPASASQDSNHATSNTSNEVPKDIPDAPHAESLLRRRTRNTLAQQAAVPENAPHRAQGPRRSLRRATTTRPDNQDGPGPTSAQARHTRPKRSRGDETAETEQPAPPPKRVKKSGGGKGRASTASDEPTETTSGPRENLPATENTAVEGARTIESESNRDSQKGGTRRSARIANRQAAVATVTQTAPPSSRPRRVAKKYKTTSSDTQVVIAPKSGKKRRSRR